MIGLIVAGARNDGDIDGNLSGMQIAHQNRKKCRLMATEPQKVIFAFAAAAENRQQCRRKYHAFSSLVLSLFSQINRLPSAKRHAILTRATA